MDKRTILRAVSVVIIVMLLLNMLFLALRKISWVMFWVNIAIAFIALQGVKLANAKDKRHTK